MYDQYYFEIEREDYTQIRGSFMYSALVHDNHNTKIQIKMGNDSGRDMVCGDMVQILIWHKDKQEWYSHLNRPCASWMAERFKYTFSLYPKSSATMDEPEAHKVSSFYTIIPVLGELIREAYQEANRYYDRELRNGSAYRDEYNPIH